MKTKEFHTMLDYIISGVNVNREIRYTYTISYEGGTDKDRFYFGFPASVDWLLSKAVFVVGVF